MRVIDFFDRGASLGPDRPCLVSGEHVVSYRDVQASTWRFARAAWTHGLKCGHKAAVIGPNSIAAFECVLGIFRADLTWVPLNYRNGTDENVHILNAFDVVVLFYDSSTSLQVEAFRRLCPNLASLVCIDTERSGAMALEAWLAKADAGITEPVDRIDDVVTISPTGGTTGNAKGVMWSNLTWQTLIASQIAAFPSNVAPVHLVVAPMTHAAGIFAIVWMAIGAANVILQGFDPGHVIDAIGRHRVTHLFLPPTAIYALLADPRVREGRYASLRYFIYSAAPISTDKVREAVDVFGPCMATLYGQVEAPASLTCMLPSELVEGGAVREDRLASCGRRMLLTQIEVVDEDDRPVPAGTRGEIVCKGTLVMLGYYKNEAATNDVWRNGWHHTGDIGYFNDDGYLFIVDRKKDMIITGGFNVYPNEVEQVLARHRAVQDCAVIGVPDPKWGEAVHAVVELKAGQEADAQALLAFLRERLGGVKTPKTLEIVPALPRTGAGKISKKDLRSRYWLAAGRVI
jgi:acyl-CoA synthetase (AMP-forming)/AMP-acid ligase II